MIVRETASVCALPAPVKPKRCFRSPLRGTALPFPWPALGLTFPIAFSIWAMKQQENTSWAVAGSGKMCRFLQRESWDRVGRQGKVCRKNLNTTCIFHMTRQLFIIPLNPAVPPAPASAHPGKKIVDFAARRRRFMLLLLLLLSWLGMRCDRWLLRQLPCVAIPPPLPPPAGCSSCCCC